MNGCRKPFGFGSSTTEGEEGVIHNMIEYSTGKYSSKIFSSVNKCNNLQNLLIKCRNVQSIHSFVFFLLMNTQMINLVYILHILPE